MSKNNINNLKLEDIFNNLDNLDYLDKIDLEDIIYNKNIDNIIQTMISDNKTKLGHIYTNITNVVDLSKKEIISNNKNSCC